MKRLTHCYTVQKCNLFYDKDGQSYRIGTISKELLEGEDIFIYVFDIDKRAVKELKKKYPKDVFSCFIPGIDLDDGYYQAFSRLPFFIESRVVDGRRQDIQTYLDRFDMEYYDAFTMFMRSEGRSLDNFHVEEEPVTCVPLERQVAYAQQIEREWEAQQKERGKQK